MNLTNFLRQTDSITAQYSAEQLSSFVHDIGRIMPERYREDFLERLKAAGDVGEKAAANAASDDFKKMYSLVRENLKLIDSQEITIESILNEEYDDWYDSGEDEFYYTDSSGVSDTLEQACDFVHTCMDTEKYKEGFEIGKQLFSMEILCEGEYGDEEVSIEDMVRYELVERDLRRIALDTAYCAYNAAAPKKRPEMLFDIITNVKTTEITLEAVMQHGDDELPDFQDFLPLWITYLGTKMNYAAERLILEAVGLLNDVSAASAYAEKYADIHPGLYVSLLENGKFDDVHDMIALGMEAVRKIPQKYIIRSRVALKTAECMEKAGMEPFMVRNCYFAAYESDTSAVNYLRALLHEYDKEKREALRRVHKTFGSGRSNISYNSMYSDRQHSEREENSPDKNMILMLEFLNGQFDKVLSKGLNCTKALGWTGTFMKQGIALFLLYLNDDWQSGKGAVKMAEIVKEAMNFSAEEYWRGMIEHKDISENDLFHELFLEWKAAMPMEPDLEKRAVKKIASLIEKRTDGIMEANRRNYYGECAAYIAALGEAQESLGDIGAKQRIMTSYKDKYFRRNAFRAELRNYGWIDFKRK